MHFALCYHTLQEPPEIPESRYVPWGTAPMVVQPAGGWDMERKLDCILPVRRMLTRAYREKLEALASTLELMEAMPEPKPPTVQSLYALNQKRILRLVSDDWLGDHRWLAYEMQTKFENAMFAFKNEPGFDFIYNHAQAWKLIRSKLAAEMERRWLIESTRAGRLEAAARKKAEAAYAAETKDILHKLVKDYSAQL